MYKHIRFEVENKVATLTLTKPPLNVMDIEMMNEMCDALETLLKESNFHALVIRSGEKVFSAGVSVEDHLGEKGEAMIHLFHKMFQILLEVPCPTIAVVESAAIGGGCELATACDIVIATEKAKFGQPEINLALFPPVSAVTFPWITGVNRTMELLLTGDTIDVQKAYEWGFVNKIVLPEELEITIEELLGKFRSKSSVALKYTKKAVREAMANSYAGSIGKVEHLYLRGLLPTEDAQEGLHSFIEKRKPEWKNK